VRVDPIAVGGARYDILDRIARGSMGEVYRAVDRRLGRVVALKVVRSGRVQTRSHPRPRCPEVARARLRLEARVMAGLSHPNIVPVFAIESTGARLVIAMEYVRGKTLAQWLASPRCWREILAVLCAAGDGLAAAHAAGVIHRDVKPDNVLIGDDGRVRVTDFGLAMLVDAPDAQTDDDRPADTSELDESLTQTGMSVGTPAYMAVEQHIGAPIDARTDQFGFCAMLYEALFGLRPFAGSSVLGLARAKRHMSLQSPLRGGEVPGAVRRAVMRGLAPDPAQRHASMTALLDEIRAAARRGDPRWWRGIAVVFAASVACTLAMSPAAADQVVVDVGSAIATHSAERIAGPLTDAARLLAGQDAAAADRVLADLYFEALGEHRFRDAARAAEMLARLHGRDADITAKWQRHAEAARVRELSEALRSGR
jgi:serine/threonine protein kinase